MTDKKLMQQALEALEVATTPLARDRQEVLRAQAALRERLAQPEQEPVWIQPNHLQKARQAPFLCRVEPEQRDDFVPLYTAPQPRQWQGLTDEDRKEALISVDAETRRLPPGFRDFAEAIEAKLREKNT